MEYNEIKKLDMKSKNIINDNIYKIGNLFPNVIKEGKIDFDELKQELSNDLINNSKEKYQLTWPGKNEAIIKVNSQIYKTLRPIKKDSINFNKTKNIYIEGDNFEALKILQESYLNKIKCIYIDPPYNTGNDFIYNDKFNKLASQELLESGQIDTERNRMITNNYSNGRFHSNWLSMIYTRLKLARSLLSENGLIYISIDDNEYDNLKKICDELFGETNYINTIVINMSNMSGPKIQHAINGKRFPKIKEYLLIYSKNKDKYKMIIPKQKKNNWDSEYNLIIPEFTQELINTIENSNINELNSKINKMKLYTIKEYLKSNNILETDEWKIKNAYRIFASKPNTALLKKASKMNFESNIAFINNSLGQKKLIKTDFNKDTKTARIELVNALDKSMMFYGDHWNDIVTTGGTGQEGDVFYGNGKKPIKLLKRIIKSSNNPSIVMDFFSGSASTAHAVMKINSEEHSNIQYIMIQIDDDLDKSLAKTTGENKNDIKNTIDFLDNCNRPHILSEIGKERIRRAAKKIKEETNADIDYGFRVYKVDSSNMKNVYYEPSKLGQQQLNNLESNIKEDRTPEDLLTQVILDLGLTLDLKIEEKEILNNKVYFVAQNNLVACFDNEINIDIIDEICKTQPLKVVFRESSFKNDSEKINTYERIKKLSPETEINVL